MICFEIILLLLFEVSTYLPVRHYSVDIGWGDIYYSSGYYKIQVKGNALIPFVYMLSYVFDIFPLRIKKTLRIVFLISIIIAGNFAFYIALFAFHVVLFFYNIETKDQLWKKLLLFLTALFFLLPFIIDYVFSTLNVKTESLGTRWDQAAILLNDLVETPLTTFFGKGLGNTVSIQSSYRDYTDNIYFELQSLYFLNQLGLFFFSVFLSINIMLTVKYIENRKLILIYLSYIIYAVTNPYILDTNQVVVICVLVSLNNKSNENRLRFSSVQP